jgi:cyclic beta-1,2-glucan synthetase
LKQRSVFAGRQDLIPRDAAFDWFGECHFPGKGIYNVAACADPLHKNIPEGKILSHDTFEGFWLHPGFSGSAEILENFPTSYMRLADRAHRWIRGDWQNLFVAIHLSCTGRKIPTFAWLTLLRQIRSSVLTIAFVLAIIVGMLSRDAGTVILFTAIYSFSSLAKTLEKIVVTIPPRYGADGAKILLNEIRRWVLYSILDIGNSLHRALISLDAIIRTTWRVKRKTRLLEWKSSASVESTSKSSPLSTLHLIMSSALSTGLFAYLVVKGDLLGLSCIYLIFWMVSPLLSLRYIKST